MGVELRRLGKGPDVGDQMGGDFWVEWLAEHTAQEAPFLGMLLAVGASTLKDKGFRMLMRLRAPLGSKRRVTEQEDGFLGPAFSSICPFIKCRGPTPVYQPSCRLRASGARWEMMA